MTIVATQLADDVGAWREPLGVLSVVSEAAAFVAATIQWRGRADRRAALPRIAAY